MTWNEIKGYVDIPLEYVNGINATVSASEIPNYTIETKEYKVIPNKDKAEYAIGAPKFIRVQTHTDKDEHKLTYSDHEFIFTEGDIKNAIGGYNVIGISEDKSCFFTLMCDGSYEYSRGDFLSDTGRWNFNNNNGVLTICDRFDSAREAVKIPGRKHTTVIVYWKDGTETPVQLGEGEEFNVYSAFTAALAKKIYGSTTRVHKLVDEVLEENVQKKQAEEKAKRVADQKERERRNHERKVRELAKKMKLEREALELIAKNEKLDSEEKSND